MKKLSGLTIILLIWLFITGCATAKKVWTEEEWTQMTAREFKGKTSKEVLDTVQKVLQLADESDVKIYRFPNKLIAVRKYFLYVVLSAAMGTYNFEVQTEEKEDKIIARLLITHSGSGIFGAVMPGAAGGYYNPQAMIVPTPTIGGEIIDSVPVYSLFFARMESLLYGKPWITCRECEDYIIGCGIGAREPLCLVADDKSPFDNASKKDE